MTTTAQIFTRTPEIRIDLYAIDNPTVPPCFMLGCASRAQAQVRLPDLADCTWVSACALHLYRATNRALLIAQGL